MNEQQITQSVVAAVGNILPQLVREAVAAEVAGAWGEVEDYKNRVFEAVEEQGLRGVAEVVQESYVEHLAVVCVRMGMGVGEYAKIARREKERNGDGGGDNG